MSGHVPKAVQALLDLGWTEAKIRASGVTWKTPPKPSELTKIRDMVEDSLAEKVGELDTDVKERLADDIPAVKMVMLVDFRNGVPKVTKARLAKVVGKAGDNEAFLNIETGERHARRIDAIHRHGQRANHDVLRKQMGEYLPFVRKVTLDDHGDPVSYAEHGFRKEDTWKAGDPLTEAFLDKLEERKATFDAQVKEAEARAALIESELAEATDTDTDTDTDEATDAS